MTLHLDITSNLHEMPETVLLLSSSEKAKILKQAQTGKIDLIKYHKSQDQNFHWSTLRYEKTGDTVLHSASRLGFCEVVKYLLTFHPSAVDCKNNDDKTPLHEAAQFSQREIVKILVENGATVNALKRADWTPLMLACTKTDYETVEILIDNESIINYRNKDGWTGVHLSAREGCDEIFKLLVNRGGDYKMKTKNGRTPLHIASLHGNGKIVESLIKLGVEVDEKDNCGNTSLHEAVLGRSVEICKILISSGANIRKKNNVGFSLLHLAASEGYIELIDYIVKDLGLDINATNLNGLTGLHCAARKGQEGAFYFLISLGCDQLIRDKFNRLASDYLK